MTDQASALGAASGGVVPSAEFSVAYRNYALLVLTLAYTANFVDRQIVSILLQPIKLELHLSDTQLGFLSGLTFAIFYVTLGIPIAMWADRSSRRNIVSLALTIFSGMTVVCGMVTSFAQMAVARIGVAVGEAGSSPPSHSMIADMFPPEKRASAMGIYATGINFGILLGFLVGGWVSQWYGWRAAFFIVGAPGLLIAALVRFTLKEPARGHADGLTAQGAAAAPKIREVFKLLWSQKSFRHLSIGAGLITLNGFAGVNWLPSFLMRSFHMSPGSIGTTLALMIGIIGGAGTFLAGYLADRLGKRDVRWNYWIIAAAMVVSFPFTMSVYLSGNQFSAFLCFVLPTIAATAHIAPALAMTQALATVRMRAQASAVFFLIMNTIGMGVGPQLVGILSDLYEPTFGAESLRYALLTVSVSLIWAAVHFVLGARTLKADIERARQYGLK